MQFCYHLSLSTIVFAQFIFRKKWQFLSSNSNRFPFFLSSPHSIRNCRNSSVSIFRIMKFPLLPQVGRSTCALWICNSIYKWAKIPLITIYNCIAILHELYFSHQFLNQCYFVREYSSHSLSIFFSRSIWCYKEWKFLLQSIQVVIASIFVI